MATESLNRHRRCAILFVRAPQIGAVKTRLEKALDADTVLRLYRCFVKDVIETAKAGADVVRICFYPAHQKASVMNWLGEGVDYFPQTGADLGSRMKNAFLETFKKGFSRAVLIGTDIPDLPGAVLTEAFFALEKGKPVIGPAKDGGYYLIGFDRNTFCPAVFDNMAWGRDDVFKQTLAAFEKAGRQPHIVAKWQDIDDHRDLFDLADRCRANPGAAPHTIRCLKRTGIDMFFEPKRKKPRLE